MFMSSVSVANSVVFSFSFSTPTCWKLHQLMERIVLALCWSRWWDYPTIGSARTPLTNGPPTSFERRRVQAIKKWEGDRVRIIPLNSTVAGKRFKLKFVGVPELLIADIVMPVLQKLGQVKKVSSEEEMARGRPAIARRRAQAIGDVDKVSTCMEHIVDMRGSGGSDIKKRKFADNCANAIERSQIFASSGMRQMKEDTRDTVE